MASKIVLLTLGDIKDIIAEKFNVKNHDITIFNNETLSITTGSETETVEEDEHYILQLLVDMPV